MSEWALALVLPNLRLSEPIEGVEVALAPRHDERIVALEAAHANIGPFLDRFSDAFQVRVQPAAMLVREDASTTAYDTQALAGFRDLVAMSVIPRNRAWELMHGRQHRILWSDTFAFYPWTLDKNYEYLVVQTPALLGMHLVEKFHGQSAPELPGQMSLNGFDIDQPLLASLIERWRRRYLKNTPDTDERKLFRSLNMAYQASRIPAGRDVTFYDVGRSLALWVSAFEIVAHTGARSGRMEVVSLLKHISWLHPRLRARRFKIKPKGPRGTYPEWLYGLIYQARNDFLHGNPATARNLRIKRSGQSLFVYAAPLYRMALAAFLNLAWRQEAPEIVNGGAKCGEWMAAKYDFEYYQRVIEGGLLSAIEKRKNEEEE